MLLTGWPRDIRVGSYTADGLEKMIWKVAELRRLNLPQDQFRAEARAIMDRQKADDKPFIEAFIRQHGIPG